MRSVALLIVLLLWSSSTLAAEPEVQFTPEERAMIQAHGPWYPPQPNDPSNRYSGNPEAIALGKLLFHSKALSKDRNQSCATCHQPARSFSDGEARSTGLAVVDRNSIALLNMTRNRWYGWGGKSDTLWGQSIHPIVDEKELGLSPQLLLERISAEPTLLAPYKSVFGSKPESEDPEKLLVDVGKALASWQETIWTGSSPFDEFRRKMGQNGGDVTGTYPLAARRGLKLFAGKAKCSFCHFGPNFSDGEFHDIGLPFFVDGGRVDSGRYTGIQQYLDSAYRRNGKYSDEPADKAEKSPGRFVKLQHRNWGEFRTPSLRNVSQTAPYMHDGSLKTLTDVVRHYSELDMERLHTSGESLLQPLKLSEQEISDLVEFLKSLTGPVYHQ